MKQLAAIVLAAGMGTRMKSKTPKVLHEVCGRPMLHYPLMRLKELAVKLSIVVVGDHHKEIEAAAKGSGNKHLRFVLQSPPRGTGDAVRCAMKKLAPKYSGDVLILSGDVPLIETSTLKAMIRLHRKKKQSAAAVTVLSVLLEDPSGYGRIVRDTDGQIIEITEDKDCTPSQKKIQEINAGIYIIDALFLRENLKKIKANNSQGEYYLPDLIKMARKSGKRVASLLHINPEEIMGINNRVQLAKATAAMQRNINAAIMLSGVTLIDPKTTYIDDEVTIGGDSTIYPNVHLKGTTTIAKGATIEEGVKITDSTIGANTVVKSHSIIEDSRTGANVSLGPFARLRPGTIIKDGAHIGNFVEVKNSTIGRGTKAGHLSYLGDSSIGSNVNIGAGVLTCNYDGKYKYKTVIKDNAFIGSDTQLIAPVTIGKGAYIGSGSTITKDVAPNSLALSRAEEKTIPNWTKKKRKKKTT